MCEYLGINTKNNDSSHNNENCQNDTRKNIDGSKNEVGNDATNTPV